MFIHKLLIRNVFRSKPVAVRGYREPGQPPKECPPCPKKEPPQPRVVMEKKCEPCSFWKQEQEVCEGNYRPKMYTATKPRSTGCHNCQTSSKKCNPPDPNEKSKCSELNINECKDIPDCPKANWHCSQKVDDESTFPFR
ncbi:PREDICTED: uncharacterized protein LOC108557315 [Nicrophorus vespilloides]|uniref:Uncharacterized protein LOC108557315 n=1 Tax=Nicrophorus vespilloides TaxID=110193 RepID=A0ABM1M3X1_NICVS|nr:PREDICTED: uncharacterized protein LOC108557315 [Nicrophorus vespilloides]